MNIAGIDIGYGYTKVYTSYTSLIFPTLVSHGVPSKNFGPDIPIISVGNSQFVVGEHTELLMGNFRVTKDFIGKPEYVAVLGYALSKLNRPDVVVLGLPPGFYNTTKINELKKILSTQEIAGPNGGVIPIPEQIEYIPQGAGIYFAYAVQHQDPLQTMNVAVVDIGYYTMDTALFASGKYVEEAGKSYPSGVSLLIDKIKSLYGKYYSSFISDDGAEKLLRYGEFTHFGKKYTLDVEPIIKAYINDYLMTVIGDYATLIKALQKTVDLVLLGGGGVTYVAKYVESITVVPDPQMANARGFYEYGRSIATKL